jgi:hypothetical protein
MNDSSNEESKGDSRLTESNQIEDLKIDFLNEIIKMITNLRSSVTSSLPNDDQQIGRQIFRGMHDLF